MKRIFLVDFENVHSDGLRGLNRLLEADCVCLFCSENASSVSLNVADICGIHAVLKYNKLTETTKNALDFQLSSYLGFLINESVHANTLGETRFFVISKDAGFDAVVNFWTQSELIRRLKISPLIVRAETIEAALSAVSLKTAPLAKAKRTVDEIMKAAKNYNDFHTALAKEYGMPTGSGIYKENKARFKELKKL